MTLSGKNIAFLFEKLIATNIDYEVVFVDGDRDVVIFKDVYLYANGLNIKYFSRKNNNLKTSLIETIKTINNKITEHWIEEIKEREGDALSDFNKETSQTDLNFKHVNLALAGPVAVPIGGPKNKILLSVSKLNKLVKKELEQNKFQHLWVWGEVSNFTQATSGHAYFNLKDENASIGAVMFRNAMSRIKFRIENGLKVEVLANVSVYAKRGNYQLLVERMSPEGIGELQLSFEQLKKQLASEGLFDISHKKPIPKYPETIGVITSSTGAALHDIIKTTKVEFPNVRLIVYPSLVQGEKAAEQMAKMIELANKHGVCDVLIIGRGGGSIEDLWAFNEEVLARAIFFSSIPIISAVGHEIDFVIADFVSDYRAATPTAAAEYLSRHKKILKKNLNLMENKIAFILNQRMQGAKFLLEKSAPQKLIRYISRIHQDAVQRIDELDKDGKILFEQKHRDTYNYFHQVIAKLDALSPFKVLKRGYSVVYNDKNEIINDENKLNEKDKIKIRFHQGDVRAIVIKESK